jgi:hypothetical protein
MKARNRTVNSRRIKGLRSYTVEEASQLGWASIETPFAQWIKAGLAVIDTRRPVVMTGRDARKFLEARRATAGENASPGQMYCFKCRVPRQPTRNEATFVATTTTVGSLKRDLLRLRHSDASPSLR